MAFSVETLSGLEHKVRVTVPAELIDQEANKRLKEFAPKVKMHGFREGKVPMNVVKKRYFPGVYQEVAKEMLESTLKDALKDAHLVPAGFPSVECDEIVVGKDFTYTVVVETMPQINVNELNQEPVEIISSEVKDADVDAMINDLRKQHMTWNEVTVAARDGDKVLIDFEGFIDDVAFEGGQAHDHELILGSKSFIPGFEEGLVGVTPAQSLDVMVTFPETYHQASLAGKEARFHVTVKKVSHGELPDIDDAFIAKFNLKDGQQDTFKKNIQDHMQRELKRRVSSMNRDTIFDQLLAKNTIDIPKTLVEEEIKHLQHEMYHRVFGHDHKDDENISQFPTELFEENAKRRVHMSLLFAEYIKKHAMTIDNARVDAMIDQLASSYEDPEELRSWYYNNKKHLADVQAVVMEEMVSEKILEDAKVVEKTLDYQQVMQHDPR